MAVAPAQTRRPPASRNSLIARGAWHAHRRFCERAADVRCRFQNLRRLGDLASAISSSCAAHAGVVDVRAHEHCRVSAWLGRRVQVSSAAIPRSSCRLDRPQRLLVGSAGAGLPRAGRRRHTAAHCAPPAARIELMPWLGSRWPSSVGGSRLLLAVEVILGETIEPRSSPAPGARRDRTISSSPGGLRGRGRAAVASPSLPRSTGVCSRRQDTPPIGRPVVDPPRAASVTAPGGRSCRRRWCHGQSSPMKRTAWPATPIAVPSTPWRRLVASSCRHAASGDRRAFEALQARGGRFANEPPLLVFRRTRTRRPARSAVHRPHPQA